MTTYTTTVDSPIGPLTLVSDGDALTGLYMDNGRQPSDPSWVVSAAPFAEVAAQLDGYFAGERKDFDVPLRLVGTTFSVRVWEALREIPYGETTSYGELARRIDRAGSSRAVGMANGRNPIAVIVPCHRVIGADGSLTGYGGGMQRKRFLLDLETAHAAQQRFALR